MDAPAPSPPAMLVVEHDPDIREVLVAALSEGGYRSTAVATTEEAIVTLDAAPFALVLTDGFSTMRDPALARIAALLHAAGTTPVVLVTAHRFSEAQLAAAGIRAVIEKPFNIDDLLRRVDALLHVG